VGSGLVRGARVPIAGVVSMDMAMLDVTGIDCGIGEVVTFLGTSGDACLTAEEVAAAGRLSPYELLTGLQLRLPRHYLGAD
jgi:alanine racemase